MERHISAKSSISGFDMLPWKVRIDDGLSRLFSLDISLLSERADWDFDKVLGKDLQLEIRLPNGRPRRFNGFISEFAQTGWHGRYNVYRAVVRPWMWFLDQTSDCRIFQNRSVPEILKEVFGEHGFAYEERYDAGRYHKRVYCVQYSESDFHFVTRLMEEEGIYYYFAHEGGEHTLVMCDDMANHEPLQAYASISFQQHKDEAPRESDHIDRWLPSMRIQPGAVVLRDFDFEKPRADLTASAAITRGFKHSKYEVFDFPGRYVANAVGDHYAKVRVEQRQSGCHRIHGQGNLRGLTVGGLFNLEEHPRQDQNREYLVVNYHLEASLSDYTSGVDPELELRVDFEAMPSSEVYRPPLITYKPRVEGPQTAIVVGPKGDEIHTDNYGRVMCQFAWDRADHFNEKSSCWIRVSQGWSGKNWGAVMLPRIGQEVIVDFLEGDADRPIITGRVYNADQPHPYNLPANKTQSGIKTRSTKGGTPANFNEIRFEDKKGKEQVYIHAEKNQDNVVENDETTDVGRNRTETVGNNETLTVGKNRKEDIEGKHTTTVQKNITWESKTGDITLKTAGADITLKASGDIFVNGKLVQVIGSKKITLN